MPDVPIPSGKLVVVLSPECAAWMVEHCPGMVQGFTDGLGFYAIYFERPEDAEAFRARWLFKKASEIEKDRGRNGGFPLFRSPPMGGTRVK